MSRIVLLVSVLLAFTVSAWAGPEEDRIAEAQRRLADKQKAAKETAQAKQAADAKAADTAAALADAEKQIEYLKGRIAELKGEVEGLKGRLQKAEEASAARVAPPATNPTTAASLQKPPATPMEAAIRDGRVVVGMTAAQAQRAIQISTQTFRDFQKTETIGKGGKIVVREVWYMNGGGVGIYPERIQLQDGIVVQIDR